MKHKAILVALTIVGLGLSSAVLVVVSHRAPANGPPSHDMASRHLVGSRIGKLLDLPSLTSKAGIIVVGKILDLSVDAKQDKNSNPEKSFVATLRIDRVLKGSLDKPTLAINFVDTRESAIQSKRIAPSLFAMFFLNEDSPNRYVLADPAFQAVVATEVPQDSRGDALERVVNELRNVLISTASSESDQLQAVDALASTDSPSANQVLRQALGSKYADVKLEAEAGLLRHNDVGVLKLLEGMLMKSPAEISDNGLLRLSGGLRDGIRDPSAVPILARLLTAHDPRVRRAAVHALREMHSATVISPLSKALNDTDQMVRYDAVLGLSEATGDFTHAPSVDTFQRDEKKYILYWQERGN